MERGVYWKVVKTSCDLVINDKSSNVFYILSKLLHAMHIQAMCWSHSWFHSASWHKPWIDSLLSHIIPLKISNFLWTVYSANQQNIDLKPRPCEKNTYNQPKKVWLTFSIDEFISVWQDETWMISFLLLSLLQTLHNIEQLYFASQTNAHIILWMI